MQVVTLHDGRKVKLGRIRPKSRPNVLHLGNYMMDDGPPPPDVVDYTAKAQKAIAQMYLNDQEGDCVIAGHAHAVGIWTGNESGNPVIASDDEIQALYQGICGPGDNGCVITNVLDYMKSNGLTLGGLPRKIDGYVSVDWTNQNEVKVALYLFGALTLGINLPNEWTSAQVWDETDSRIVGGHDVTAAGYNDQGVTICTWGGTRLITWKAFMSTQWLDECYALLSPDWYSGSFSPTSLDGETLKADLAKLGGGTIPPIDPFGPPDPNPTPGPSPTPTPTPGPSPTPTPSNGLSLDQAVAAVEKGIDDGGPYGMFNVVGKVEQAAIQALKNAWPK